MSQMYFCTADSTLHCVLLVEAGVDVRRGLEEGLGRRDLLAEDVALEHVREPHARLVVQEVAARDREDLVELLEREALRLRHEAEDADERDDVEARVEAERAELAHRRNHRREREAQHAREEQVDEHRPRHALLAVHVREDLRAVLERDGALREGVEDGEDVDEPAGGERGETSR
jgi:hypothetical protein